MSETMSGAPMLEVSGLTKRFGGLVAVKNLSFSIRPGEILGLIGPNGSGKSTAMKSVMGVERPTAGSVKLDGVELAGDGRNGYLRTDEQSAAEHHVTAFIV